MKEGGGEGGDEDCCARDGVFGGFGLEREKGNGGEKAEYESGRERVKISAIESEIGGGAEVSAQEVSVGDCAGEGDGERGGSGEAGEGGALKSKRGQGVGEGIHRGEVISEPGDRSQGRKATASRRTPLRQKNKRQRSKSARLRTRPLHFTGRGA